MSPQEKRAVRRVMAAGAGLLLIHACSAQEISNRALILRAEARDGTYSVTTPQTKDKPVLRARAGARIAGRWVYSSDYPQRRAAESPFRDGLGAGREIRVTCTGLPDRPDLAYILQLYQDRPYGSVQVELTNRSSSPIAVQALRSAEAVGSRAIDLGGPPSAGRILSDSFSEDWPQLVIYDFGQAPGGVHRGFGSQLMYNRQSRQSLFFGALTADRWLTLIHLSSTSFTVDSTGTTEIQKEMALRGAPAAAQIDLTLPLPPGAKMASERVMVAAGSDYRSQLTAYGEAIRQLHRARVAAETPLGWWSWTSFYMLIDEGAALTNADWLAQHLKSLGYRFLHLDEGYQYARGEYTTPNATQFPHGIASIADHVRGMGLTFGLWTAPFEVSTRAAIYQNHKDWLVHDAGGAPIDIGRVADTDEHIFALDTTNPGAQEYIRQTYRTLTRDWGVRYIKLDFMDTAAIEGFRFRPNTTALEAQRIGLELIRSAVGEDVLLDKDGSPMLTPVGLVDAGRISADTRHTFAATRMVEPGIAARFYMNRNFYINDPDAFNLAAAAPAIESPGRLPPVTLEEAQASIALSAVSGGMYEIGDDLASLGRDPARLALVENRDLLNMAKLGKSSIPMDLLTYAPEDRQPSIFLLKEEPRQAILTVFNWTEQPRSHVLALADLGLAGGKLSVSDVLNGNARVPIQNGEIRLANEKPHSVRVLKLIDEAVAPSAPAVRATVPTDAKLTAVFRVSAEAAANGTPPLSYSWDFGDGTTSQGAAALHAYTADGDYTIKLTAEGLDGTPAAQSFRIKVTGSIGPFPDLKQFRRYTGQQDR